MLDIEYRMVRQSQGLSNAANHQVNLEYRERIIKNKDLSESQGEAFRHITGDRDMACVVGYAGSGKSYMLGAARESWEREGYNVIGMTLSGIAAESLEGESGIKSHTVANRMVNWNNDRERLNKNDIVVVDEAGMLGSRDLAKIIDEVTLADAKVVLIGDPQQLQAIEAGGAFRGVIERVGQHVEAHVQQLLLLAHRQPLPLLLHWVGGLVGVLLLLMHPQRVPLHASPNLHAFPSATSLPSGRRSVSLSALVGSSKHTLRRSRLRT